MSASGYTTAISTLTLAAMGVQPAAALLSVAPIRSGQQRHSIFRSPALVVTLRYMDKPSCQQTAEFGLRYQGAAVRVGTDSASLSAAVRRQFSAYGTEVCTPSGEMPAVTVHLSADRPPRFGRLPVPHGGGDITWAKGTTFVHAGPPLAVVNVGVPDITLITEGAPPYPAFTHYLVKYPLRQAVEQQGGVLVHSACLAVPGGPCCLFVGPSGAGKTTVFIEMITRGLMALGHDATLLRVCDAHVDAALWPHVVRLGDHTIRCNPVLRKLTGTWAPRNPRDGKTEVFFDTLDDVFGRSIAGPPARVDAVAALELDIAGSRTEIRALNRTAAGRLLRDRIMGDRPRTGWLPGWQWQADPGPVQAVTERLAATVPVYAVRVGVSAPGWADDLAQWIKDLRAGPDQMPEDAARTVGARA
jgi:hypothetical protein